LVYISGLPQKIAEKDILESFPFLSQYGAIEDIFLNQCFQSKKKKEGENLWTCHVTFSNTTEAALTILAMDGMTIDGRPISASFGLTRYCCYFLR